jgi:hypothetical protein
MDALAFLGHLSLNRQLVPEAAHGAVFENHEALQPRLQPQRQAKAGPRIGIFEHAGQPRTALAEFLVKFGDAAKRNLGLRKERVVMLDHERERGLVREQDEREAPLDEL